MCSAASLTEIHSGKGASLSNDGGRIVLHDGFLGDLRLGEGKSAPRTRARGHLREELVASQPYRLLETLSERRARAPELASFCGHIPLP